jgi:hypothetical protein
MSTEGSTKKDETQVNKSIGGLEEKVRNEEGFVQKYLFGHLDGRLPADLHPSDLHKVAEHIWEIADDHQVHTDDASDFYQSLSYVEGREGVVDAWEDVVDEKGQTSGWVDEVSNHIPEHVDTRICVKQGAYGVHNEKFENGELVDIEFEQITSFVFDVQEYVQNSQSGELEIRMEVVPASDEDSYTVTVSPTVFNDARTFKEEVCTGLTTTFDGSIENLNELRQIAGQQHAEHVKGHTTVGLHDGVMVTPQGTIGGSCWTDFDTQQKYLDSGQQIDNRWVLEVDDSDGEFDSDAVAEVLELLVESRSDEDRYLPVVGWWMASLVAPKIRDWEGELPSVMVSGDTGAGKSSFLEALSKLSGLDGSAGSAKDTKFALIKGMSSTNNVPVWFDEYKPSDMRSYQINNLQDFLRKSTRAGTETRGNADQTTTSYQLTAPVIFSGEQAIQGAAEERRMIRTQFRQPEGTEKAFAKLFGGSYTEHGQVTYTDGADFDDAAAALWQWIVDSPDCTDNDAWQDAQRSVYSVLEANNIAGIDDLELTALTMIQFGTQMYFKFAGKSGAELCVSVSDVEDAIVYIAESMGQESRTSHLDEFLDLTSTLVRKRRLTEDENYRVMESGEVRIRVDDVHHELSKYLQDHDLDSYDLLNSPRDYKNRMRDAFDDDSYWTQKAAPDHVIGNSYCFDGELASEQVEGFEYNVFETEEGW